MCAETLFVETSLGNSFVGPDSWVYVQAGDRYTHKKARDLNKGDRLVVHNEGLDVPLEEVVQHLEEGSLKYRLAKQDIHRTNEVGEPVPLLRILLLQALAPEDTHNRERKIMLDGTDFSDEEYQEFTSQVQGVVGMSDSAVRSWLKGDTLAPADWNNFYRLEVVNPAFATLADSVTQEGGFHTSYKFYVGAHQTVRGYLVQRQERATDKPEKKARSRSGNKGVFAQELQYVLGQVMGEVPEDPTKETARVLRIKEVKPGKSKKFNGQSKPELSLKRGVVCDELQLPLHDMTKLLFHEYIIQNALTHALQRYFTLDGIPIPQKANKGVVNVVVPYTINRLVSISPIENHFFRTNFEHQLSKGMGEEFLDEACERIYKGFEHDLASGVAEGRTGFAPGTFTALCDALNQVRAALPKACFEESLLAYRRKRVLQDIQVGVYKGKAVRKAKKKAQDIRNKYTAIAKYLKETYGMEDRPMLFFPFHREWQLKQGAGVENHNEDILAEMRGIYEQQMGCTFITSTQARNALEEYGVTGVTKLFDQRNWVGEFSIFKTASR